MTMYFNQRLMINVITAFANQNIAIAIIHIDEILEIRYSAKESKKFHKVSIATNASPR